MISQEEYLIFASSYHETVVRDFLNENRIGFKQLIGSYKGISENSYIVNIKHLDFIEQAELFKGEESILLLGENLGRNTRRARLHFLDNSQPDEDLGLLRAVVKEEALAQDCWSYRPDLETYFITQ